MRTEDLIADLARQATRVRPLPSPPVRLMTWGMAVLGCLALSLLIFGVRPDAALATGRPAFLVTALFAIATTGLAAAASLVLAIPGAERSPALRAGALAGLVAWTGWLVMAVVLQGYDSKALSHSPVCFIRVVGIAAIPAVGLFLMLRRAVPLRTAWTAALALAASAAAGALAIQFICPLDDPAHALLGHLGPVMVVALVGTWLGPRWLSR